MLFVEIFGGGKADLILTEEGDVLECGIDIVARPPGKQLQSITLLSGGEQTMTAVALLFSIYQVKPSPFCVLDELDAPLDESNINRFVQVLQRFLVHSQFVIITHNKRTIGMADVLYGVTMQEHGVSKIVSVKFHKADDDADEKKIGNGTEPHAQAEHSNGNGTHASRRNIRWKRRSCRRRNGQRWRDARARFVAAAPGSHDKADCRGGGCIVQLTESTQLKNYARPSRNRRIC